MQALAEERREVAASTNSGRGPGRVCWSLRCKNMLFFVSLGIGKVVKQKSGREKKESNLKESEGLKTIYLEVTYPSPGSCLKGTS